MGSNFIGSIIFEFIGVFVKWIFFQIITKGKGRENTSFVKMWRGRSDEFADQFEMGVSNIFLGMGIVILAVLIIKILIN